MAATTPFRIATFATTVQPAQHDTAVWPLVEAPPVVRYPAPTMRSGTGYPGGIHGLPWANIGRHRITASGIAFYNGLFANANAESALVKVVLFDPRAASVETAWTLYKGILWRPTYAEPTIGGYEFTEFRAMITELEITTWGTT